MGKYSERFWDQPKKISVQPVDSRLRYKQGPLTVKLCKRFVELNQRLDLNKQRLHRKTF